MRILGGVVSYEDGIKTTQGDQFSPTRKVRVELNFSLDATDANGSTDPAIQVVLDKAQQFVNGKLGIVLPTAAARTVAPAAPAKVEEPKPEAKAAKAPKAPKAEKPAPQVDLEELTPAAETGKSKADLAKEAGVNVEIAGKGDLKLVDDGLEVSTAAAPPAAPPANDISDLIDLIDLMGSTAKQYSDLDLNDLAQKAMGRINTPENPGGPKIRKLVSEFLPAGTQPVMAKIPQEKREEFVAKLNELK